MSVKRKRYSAVEKAKIALEAIKGELTMAQITSKYSVQAGQVNNWKKRALAYLPDAFADKSKEEMGSGQAELAGLYEQIGRLKVENDFLKKKSEVFHG